MSCTSSHKAVHSENQPPLLICCLYIRPGPRWVRHGVAGPANDLEQLLTTGWKLLYPQSPLPCPLPRASLIVGIRHRGCVRTWFSHDPCGTYVQPACAYVIDLTWHSWFPGSCRHSYCPYLAFPLCATFPLPIIPLNQEHSSDLAHRRTTLLLAPDVDALHARGIGRARTHANNGLVSGIISLLGVGGIVVGPTEPLPAFRAAEPAVVALAIEDVTAFQASYAWGDLLANQVSEQAWLMTAQPQRKPFT